MAYISTEQVAEKRAALKALMPTKDGWKFSFKKEHHSSINLTILRGPKNLEIFKPCPWHDPKTDFRLPDRREEFGIEPIARANFHYSHDWTRTYPEATVDFVTKVMAILNKGNHDRSDAMVDYFDVGFYVNFQIGAYDKPYEVVKK